MENSNTKNSLLNITINISATPAVSFEKPDARVSAVPGLTAAYPPGNFTIYLEAALQYDWLSHVVNGYLAGKRFDLLEGLFKKHIIISGTVVSGNESGDLQIQVNFEGSFNGTVFFTGKPLYNAETKTIEVHEPDYHIKTKSLLLKTAKWLFNHRIINELKKYTSFEMSDYYDTAIATLNTWFNKEWTRGIRGSGIVSNLKLTAVRALPQHLLIRSNCAGQLSMTVSQIDLKL